VTATNSERSFNEALARVLWTKHPAWRERLRAEQHRAVKGGGQPDLIVRNPLGAPVVLETEYLPARTVEQDAIARLGRVLADSGYAVEYCIALRAPTHCRRHLNRISTPRLRRRSTRVLSVHTDRLDQASTLATARLVDRRRR